MLAKAVTLVLYKLPLDLPPMVPSEKSIGHDCAHRSVDAIVVGNCILQLWCGGGVVRLQALYPAHPCGSERSSLQEQEKTS